MNEEELYAKFAKLTIAQHRMMAFQHSDTSNSSEATCKQLLAMGLIEKCQTRVLNDPPHWYEVPLPIHMTYCQWCADQAGDRS